VRAALATQPGHGEALWCEAQIAMFLEDWPAAWSRMEARWLVESTGDKPSLRIRPGMVRPLRGRPILLAERGHSEIRFSSSGLLRLLRRLARVMSTLSAHPAWLRFFTGIAGVDSVFPAPAIAPTCSAPASLRTWMFDVECSFFASRMTLQTLAKQSAYLSLRRTGWPWRGQGSNAQGLNVWPCGSALPEKSRMCLALEILQAARRAFPV